ncbi:hypothetical protein NDK47_12740 [Brevibacillus ruminantium]|uniref:WD40 repeat domain-containing protein n=1 Tax=Brevibacillus ruminantium TaxID=2950604 RepID=A0ABY4WLR6_9BACL|nr:hypothetical protein [Brevibacillus ruminantium]USG68091.1 hypothetical protein NDK47_12740 [Brevibacillus ruminantium]
MRDQERFPIPGNDEGTIAQLLSHLQQLRRAVPVNYILKEKLKKQLMQRIAEMEQERKRLQQKEKGSKLKRLWLTAGGGVILLALSLYFGVWSSDVPSVQQYELLTLASDADGAIVGLNPDGSKIAYIADKTKVRMISLQEEKSKEALVLPATSGTYTAVSWSNGGKQLAVTELVDGFSRLWIVDLADKDRPVSKRLLKEERGVTYTSPSWSQYDESIAYTRRTSDGVEEIWVSSTIAMRDWKLVEGTQPEWSPDGRLLAFVKKEQVHVLEVRSGEVKQLEAGTWPSWNETNSVTFTTPNGKINQVQLGDASSESKVIPVRRLSEGELLKAKWSLDRKHLLLAQKRKGESTVTISIASR